MVSRDWSLRPYPRLHATWHDLIRVGDYVIPCVQVANAHSPLLVVPQRLTMLGGVPFSATKVLHCLLGQLSILGDFRWSPQVT